MKVRDYRVIIEGELGPLARRAFEGVDITAAGGKTVITCPVRDQCDLHAIVRRVGDFGLTLVSVTAVDAEER